jgi:hypothetical protein
LFRVHVALLARAFALWEWRQIRIGLNNRLGESAINFKINMAVICNRCCLSRDSRLRQFSFCLWHDLLVCCNAAVMGCGGVTSSTATP